MEFCTVTAVTADMPWTPWARNVLRSAWIPAPPPESDPAMVSTRAGTGTAVTSLLDRRSGQATSVAAVDCRHGPSPPDPDERGRAGRVPGRPADADLRHPRAFGAAAPGRPVVRAGGRKARLLDLRRLPEGPQPGAGPPGDPADRDRRHLPGAARGEHGVRRRAGPRPRAGAGHRRRPGRPLRRHPRPR